MSKKKAPNEKLREKAKKVSSAIMTHDLDREFEAMELVLNSKADIEHRIAAYIYLYENLRPIKSDEERYLNNKDMFEHLCFYIEEK